MRNASSQFTLCLAFFMFIPFGFSVEPAAPVLCEPWQSEYAGPQATGPQTIALWQFSAGAETADASGHGHSLVLDGAKIAPGGRFGACLETFPGWPVEDKPHRARVKSDPRLSPAGAFTLELWIQPKPELNAEYPESFLLDKKYVAHDDYQLVLGAADRGGDRVLRACLGFGDDSVTWHSRPMRLPPGQWHHLAFTYDGDGTGRFFLDGRPWGETRIPGRGRTSPGKHPLSIGDRIGSYYHGFPGYIDQVRISGAALEFRSAKLDLAARLTVFRRMEPGISLRVEMTNLRPKPVEGGAVTLSLDGLAEKRFPLPPVPPGRTAAIDYPLDTSLRPDAYRLVADLIIPGPDPFNSRETFPVRIVPRRPPRMPVVMWGGGGLEFLRAETDRLKRIGFTHVLGIGADCEAIWDAGKPTEAARPESVAQTRRMLDEALATDLGIVASLSPGSALERKPEFLRVDRNGKAIKGAGICGLFPEIERYCENVGASVARTYGDHPAFEAAMIHTEVRDQAVPCFHPHDLEAFRKAAGFVVPAEAGGRGGVDYRRLKDFPADRVVPDDHPLYLYYRWYWKQGDGWNALNLAVDRGLKSTSRKDLWTWHDPAVRVASVYGSGGSVDIVSQWTYSYPDPIRIGLAADELLAMAGGATGRQQVMKMTQIIWYRSQTAPEAKPGAGSGFQARWERQQPDAPFITIAPMHLREAFWTKIARPIRGIMYHGWQSLVPTDSPGGYRFTHSETQHELARLVREVVQPLGPALLEAPGAGGEVAFLESFASQVFAGRGTYGWGGGWLGDAWHVAAYAHLQPEIVFDETVVQRGLDRFRVLVMADCDVLTQGVVSRVKAFQAKGGIVVGDERLCPAIKPDIVLPSYKRTGRADRDKAALTALAADLRRKLDARYVRPVDSSNPEVIPYLRRCPSGDYLFVVNDRREFGQYVGHRGLVMENGLPAQSVLSMSRRQGSAYDLVRRQPVPSRLEGGRLLFNVDLGPCEGGVFLVTDRAIGGVRIAAPDAVDRGGRAECVVEVVDPEGRPLDATVPLELTISDSEGRLAEYSGFYAATRGRLSRPLEIAGNDPPGAWRIEARELASGHRAVRDLRVRGPALPTVQPGPDTKKAANPVQPQG